MLVSSMTRRSQSNGFSVSRSSLHAEGRSRAVDAASSLRCRTARSCASRPGPSAHREGFSRAWRRGCARSHRAGSSFRPGTSGDHRHLCAQHHFECGTLRRRERLPGLALDPGQRSFDVDRRPWRRAPPKVDQPLGDSPLGEKEATQKDAGLSSDRVSDDIAERERFVEGRPTIVAPTSRSLVASCTKVSTGRAQ